MKFVQVKQVQIKATHKLVCQHKLVLIHSKGMIHNLQSLPDISFIFIFKLIDEPLKYSNTKFRVGIDGLKKIFSKKQIRPLNTQL